MKVTKRDGRLEDFNASNIHRQTVLACEGLKCDASELELSAGIMFKDKMQTSEIQTGLINAARFKVDVDTPDWTYVAARLKLYDLYHNIENYYGVVKGPGDVYNKVSLNMYISRNKDILADYFNKYAEDEITELNSYIDPKRDLLYNFTAMETMTLRYLMKRAKLPYNIRMLKNNNINPEDIKQKLRDYKEYNNIKNKNISIELPQHMHMSVAMFAAQNEKDKVYWAKKFYDKLSKLEMIAATPINSNCRKKSASTASCFVMTMGDNIEDIFNTYKEFGYASSSGGGVGYDLTMLRSIGSWIYTRYNASNGIVPNAKVANDIAVYIDQAGSRKGAFAAYLGIWHADLFNFIDLRKKEGDERARCQDLFLGLTYNDEFMSRLDKWRENRKNNIQDETIWTLFDPYDTPELAYLYGEEFSKKYNEYEQLFKEFPALFNPNTKSYPIRTIAAAIAKSYIEEGMPYAFFKCTTNKRNEHPELGVIHSSNLCVAGDTLILTKEYGNKPIKELVESGIIETECWNGNQWSLTKLVKTSDSSKLLTVTLSNGSIINATEYHKWYIDIDGNETEVRTIELQPNAKLYKYYDNEGNVYDNVRVVSVEDNNIAEATYCGNEPLRHRLMFNGVLTGNCTEFMNPTTTDEVSVCNLGSVNLAKYTDDTTLQDTVETMHRMLDNIVDVTTYKSAKANKQQKLFRSVGQGFLGEAELMANKQIYLTSKEHKEWADRTYKLIRETIDNYNKKLAEEKGSCPAVQGKRNAYTTCIAPNTTSGIFASTTNSTEPAFGKVWVEESKIGTIKMTAPNININNFAYYQDAYELDQFKLIEVEAIRQKYIDMGISHSMFIDVNKFPDYKIPSSIVIDLIIYAWKQGLKSLYYLRSSQVDGTGVEKHTKKISCIGCAN